MKPRGITRIVEDLGGSLEGPAGEGPVRGVAPPGEAGPDQIALYVDRRQRPALAGTGALAVLTDREHAAEVLEAGRAAWIHPDPARALARLVDEIYPAGAQEPPVHDPATGAWVSAGARIGAGTSLEPGCVVHGGSVIGRDCSLGACAWIGPRTRIGDRVTIGPGAVVGVDGFGLRPEHGGWIPVRHVGSVDIGDDVSIGARSVVARGTLGTTVVGRGTRVDAHVQVGHNVRIGRDCAIAAQAGIAGSTVIGDRVMIGGQAGIADHVSVGDEARIAARSGVAGDVEAGATVEGYPAVDRWTWLRMMALLKKQATDDD
jgi:UDP-3-O-[3-hydroxymyristoyl] glucosamine N-acyltransferase